MANKNIKIGDVTLGEISPVFFIAEIGINHNGILVHKDPEYEKLASEINEYRLPYKLS